MHANAATLQKLTVGGHHLISRVTYLVMEWGLIFQDPVTHSQTPPQTWTSYSY